MMIRKKSDRVIDQEDDTEGKKEEREKKKKTKKERASSTTSVDLHERESGNPSVVDFRYQQENEDTTE